MAMLAAPQPFFSCGKKGTSSQIAGACANKRIPQRLIMKASLRWTRVMKNFLANGYDDQHYDSDGDDNPDQVAITQRAGGEIVLGFIGTGGELGQILIIQGRNRGLHLARIHLR